MNKPWGTLAISGVLSIPSLLYNSWVLVIIYNWFIVQSFEVAALTPQQAIAVYVTKTFLFDSRWSDSQAKTLGELFGKIVGTSFIYPTVALVFFWIIQLVFM